VALVFLVQPVGRLVAVSPNRLLQDKLKEAHQHTLKGLVWASHLLVIASLSILSGCSSVYSDLEEAYGVEQISDLNYLPVGNISITSNRRSGILTFTGTASLSATEDAIFIITGESTFSPIMVPVTDIAACSMTCFGAEDRHINLLIPSVGSNVMVNASKKLLDWCRLSGRPMISSAARRAWQYDLQQIEKPALGDGSSMQSAEDYEGLAQAACKGM